MKKQVELLWDFGFTDEIEILFLEKQNGNFEIVDRIKNKGKDVYFYLNALEHYDYKYTFVLNHIPKIAYCETLSGQCIAKILKEAGLIINEH